MSMLAASIRKTGPLGAKLAEIRKQRIAAGLLKDDAPRAVVVLISENGGKLIEVEKAAVPKPRKRRVRRLASNDIKTVKVDGVVYPTISEIQTATCKYFGVDETDLFSERRDASIIRPRQIAIYLCKALTLHSYPAIGKRFGRDHSTAISSVRRIKLMMDQDLELSDKVNELKESIRQHTIDASARRETRP
jgi:chromosomal replication initiation ATPase DnaA